MADDPLDSLARRDVLLNGDLVARPLLEIAAHADVSPLRVFPEDDKVNVLTSFAFERTELLIEELDRTVVDVEVELKTHAEQDVRGVFHVGDARIAECAEVHGGVVVAD